jgi:hypothetical protein
VRRLLFMCLLSVLLVVAPVYGQEPTPVVTPTPEPTLVLVTPAPSPVATPTTDQYIAQIAQVQHDLYLYQVFSGAAIIGLLALLFVRVRV